MKLLSFEPRKSAGLGDLVGPTKPPHGYATCKIRLDLFDSFLGVRETGQNGRINGAGLIALTRIPRFEHSTVQLRANERTAALVAL